MELVGGAGDGPEGQAGGLADPGRVTLAGAVEVTIAAIDPPAQDAAVVALAMMMATALDDMPPGQRAAMVGQTAPQLLKVLQELEARSAKRKSAAKNSRPNRVAQLRNAHANSPAKRKRAG